MAESSGPRQVTPLKLLSIRERAWRPRLRGVSLIAEAEISADHSTQAAKALGMLYGKRNFGLDAGVDFLTQWPTCLVTAMTGVAVTGYAQGAYWPALWRATGYAGTDIDRHAWGQAFKISLDRLGLPTFEGATHHKYIGRVLMHAGIPAYCLGDFFRLLAERRRQDPSLDTDGFLAWATAPGYALRLCPLDKPAERFLLSGAEYAHDVVDRTLDLLDRLTEPDPDLDGVALPVYMTNKARDELAAGHLDLSGTRQVVSRSGNGTARQARPRIALDPYGAGVQVLLPAVGDMPDGIAQWRVTADGEARTVQSRAMWMGVAEAAPETSYPLSRPVRTVAVALVGRDELAVELQVVDPADPILFFSDDGRRLSGNLPIPRGHVWVMHPEKMPLELTGNAGEFAESPVPFGWDGWRLVAISLDGIQSVGLRGGRAHAVEHQARPRLVLGEPVPGVATAYGSPVYPEVPRLWIPTLPDAQVTWHVEVRQVGGAPLVSTPVTATGEVDIWCDVPRPLLGAFEVTVRGPLGRGLRRTVFFAEGLTVSYQPQVRLLDTAGLAQGKASLTAAAGASALPSTVCFGPGERSRPVEYRTDKETEPLVISPPHAALLCPGAGIMSWTTSLLHVATEEFAGAGRLLVRLPALDPSSKPELALYAGGQQAQVISASGQESAGLVGFELDRAVDTIAVHQRGELALRIGDLVMPVGYVRPRRLASGVDLEADRLVLRDAAAIEGLTAGVYLGYAPWRSPVELTVSSEGTAALPEELAKAGPLLVLLRVDDPWTISDWPTWPDMAAYRCLASGVPGSDDPEEEALCRFVAGEGELPPLEHHIGKLWRLIHLSNALVKLGARFDLAEQCTDALVRQPGAALLALAGEDLSHADVVRLLIKTGLAAAPEQGMSLLDRPGWRALGQLWTAFPAAAAMVTGDFLIEPEMADLATAHCGDSLAAILSGRPDPHAAVGGFGAAEERMELLSREQVEAMWMAAEVVPQALLDADTRAMAALRMFDARNDTPILATTEFVRGVTRAAEVCIWESRYPDVAEAILARRPSGQYAWTILPAMSIAMALVARLAARGDARCAALERRYRGKWANLALCAPDLVGIDLVLAEALVVAASQKPEENPHD